MAESTFLLTSGVTKKTKLIQYNNPSMILCDLELLIRCLIADTVCCKILSQEFFKSFPIVTPWHDRALLCSCYNPGESNKYVDNCYCFSFAD